MQADRPSQLARLCPCPNTSLGLHHKNQKTRSETIADQKPAKSRFSPANRPTSRSQFPFRPRPEKSTPPAPVFRDIHPIEAFILEVPKKLLFPIVHKKSTRMPLVSMGIKTTDCVCKGTTFKRQSIWFCCYKSGIPM